MKKQIIFVSIAVLVLCTIFSSCKKDSTNSFIGTYDGTNSGSTFGTSGTSWAPGPDTAYITAGSGSSNVILYDQYYGGQLNATVSGNNMTIPVQNISGNSFSGSGSLNGSTLTFTVNVNLSTGWSGTNTFTGTK